MTGLDIPAGLKAAEIISNELKEKPYYTEYLEFTQKKINQICSEVIQKLIEQVVEGRQVNLIVPLNGGLIFYRKLMELSKFNIDFSKVNVIFADEDMSSELCLSGNPIDVENAYNVAIDDIWDRGGTGRDILNALKLWGNVNSLDYYAFCKKEDSPAENDGARLANQESVAVFPEEWLHGWGGMNSGKFKGSERAARITALERTSFLPLIPTGEVPAFNPEDENIVEQYIDILTQTNLAINGVIPVQAYYDVLFLEMNPDLRARFNYLLNIHGQYIQNNGLREPETIEVES